MSMRREVSSTRQSRGVCRVATRTTRSNRSRSRQVISTVGAHPARCIPHGINVPWNRPARYVTQNAPTERLHRCGITEPRPPTVQSHCHDVAPGLMCVCVCVCEHSARWRMRISSASMRSQLADIPTSHRTVVRLVLTDNN